MKERILKIKAGIFVLANLFITCTGISSEVSKVDVPKDYSENFEIKGYEKNVYEYDLNNDGAKEKIVVNYKLNNLEIEDVYSIYTQQNGVYKLAYQITFDKKNDVFDLKEVKDKIDLVKKYFNEYSKDPQANEVRYVKIITDTLVTEKKYNDAYKLYERIKKEKPVTSMDLRFIDIVVKS